MKKKIDQLELGKFVTSTDILQNIIQVSGQ